MYVWFGPTLYIWFWQPYDAGTRDSTRLTKHKAEHSLLVQGQQHSG